MGDLGYDFTGCHVVVTGGVRGTGLAIARGFLEFGATLTITGRQYLTSYYDDDLSAFGYCQLDLTDPDSICEVAARLGHVDILVNAAAPGSAAPARLSDAEHEFVVQATGLGLIGPRQFATRLRYRLAQSPIIGGGSVINAPETRDWFELTHPETADVEFRRVTEHWGSAWARSGVRVNAITTPAPSIAVPTQSRGLRVQIEAHAGPLLTRVAAPAAAVATADPEAVTDVVLFLASRGAAALTGQVLTVRGR